MDIGYIDIFIDIEYIDLFIESIESIEYLLID